MHLFFGCKDTSFSLYLQYLKMMVSEKYLNMGIKKVLGRFILKLPEFEDFFRQFILKLS